MKHIQKLRKLILTLGILAGMSLTAYAADTTITWTNPNLHIVEVNKSYTQSGITVTMTTAPKSGGWMGDSIMSFEGTCTFVFSSSVGNIKGVVITARNVHYSNNDWSIGGRYTTLTWSGTPASSVTLSGGNQLSIDSISSIVFTIEGANVDVTGVTLNKTSTTLAAGGTETLTVTVSPNDATDKTVTWSSDNTSVATVDANGKVTAASAGTATITVTATNGTDDTSDDKQATCTITVTAEQPVTVTAKADPFTTGTYYATFYDSTKSYTADCEVYYATANAGGRLTLEKAEGNVIKAGEGVILKATSETVTLTKTTTEASYDSLLTGSDSETTVENALVLSLGKNGVWFYKYSGTLGANKAYLAQ